MLASLEGEVGRGYVSVLEWVMVLERFNYYTLYPATKFLSHLLKSD